MNWLLKSGKSVEMQKAVYRKWVEGFNTYSKTLLIGLAKSTLVGEFLRETNADIFIVEFALEELNIAEISEIVEKEYKSADGQYVWEGTFRSREFLEEFVKRDVKRLVAMFHYVTPQSGGAK